MTYLGYLSEEAGGSAGESRGSVLSPLVHQNSCFTRSQHTDAGHGCCHTHGTSVETQGQGGKRETKDTFVIRPSELRKCPTSIGS